MRVAVIGSFRKHYDRVREAIATFQRAGFLVTSPAGSDVSEYRDFVRFETDPKDLGDFEIQSITLRNIFAAHFVYVMNPDGYVGFTTCYEIGRIIQRRQPIYFLAPPNDLPVATPDWCVSTPKALVERLAATQPRWLYWDVADGFDTERTLA